MTTTTRPDSPAWASTPTVPGPPSASAPTAPAGSWTSFSPPPPPGDLPPAAEPPPVPGGRDRSGRRAALAGGLVGALVAGGVAYGTVRLTDADTVGVASAAALTPTTVDGAGTATTVAASQLTGAPLDIHELLAAVGPSVVNIEIGVQGRNGAVQPVAAGSGVIISADGLVLTNAHVVDLTDQFGRSLANAVITVKPSDGTERTATVLGADPSQDIAVLRLADTADLRPAKLGDSDTLRVGDDVVAIGNALGLGDAPTVTKGIVSATGRTLDVDANTTLTDLIQTDAPINHGNSGGALVNAAGEVVGINSAGIPDAQNVGFAIAMNTITPLLSQLESGGTTAPTGETVAYLGVSTLQSVNGVTVTGVATGSAAAAAGLQPGDVIVRIDDTAVETAGDLGSVLAGKAPGDTVTLEVSRNGGSTTVQATLGSRTR